MTIAPVQINPEVANMVSEALRVGAEEAKSDRDDADEHQDDE